MTPTRIHITGASGSGTTTLGAALAGTLSVVHFDTDSYFWLPSDPPFQLKRPIPERLDMLLGDLDSHQGWTLSGSLCGWGDPAISRFDLVIFLTLPADVRMKRLALRESKRYGNDILPGGRSHDSHVEFMDWAARYDTAGTEQRSRAVHEQWLAALPCRVLRMESDCSIADLGLRNEDSGIFNPHSEIRNPQSTDNPLTNSQLPL